MRNKLWLGSLAIISLLAGSIACRRNVPAAPTPIPQQVVVEPTVAPMVEVTPTAHTLYAPAVSSDSTPQAVQATGTPPATDQVLQYTYYFPLIQSHSIPAQPD